MVSSLQRKLWRDMARMKGQILTIALVAASATGGFVGCFSTYTSLRSAAEEYYRESRFADVFVEVKRAPLAIGQRIAALDGVAGVDLAVHEVTQLSLPGVPEPLIALLVGVPHSRPNGLNSIYLRRGRLPAAAPAQEALIDEGFATAHRVGPGDELTLLLNGVRQDFRVVGIGLTPEFLFAAVGGVIPDPKGTALVWVAEEHVATAFDMDGAFNHASLKLMRGASQPAVLGALDHLLAPYGSTGSYDRSEQLSHRALTQEMNQQRVIGTVLPGVFLWVVGFLLNVVMGRLISTQREQIAALKALGYENRRIFQHYLQFVVAVVTLGVVIGTLVGAWFGSYMTGMYREFFHFPRADYHLNLGIAGIAAAACYATAILGAVQAVWRAVSIAPAQAMHPPAPPRFGRTLVERMGLGPWMSPSLRMIVRTLERRPLRALLATLGAGGAAALVVAGTFWWDAISSMMDMQFGVIDRSDAIVSFGQPVNTSALYQARHWPGVLEAEPLRVVPVRIDAGHLSYRTSVTALRDHGALRRVLDASGREVEMPAEGLLLGDGLAGRLRVAPGATVHLQLLEGNRSSHETVVAGVVNEIFGLQAYMSVPAINHLAGEGDAISAVYLRYDRRQEQRLFDALRQTPRAATVSVKHNMLASFRETSARNVLVFSTIISLFATAIAVGVVYNHARIALAERAWELASLRVLGLSRAEVSLLLLGELAIELLAAVPVGLAMGWALAWFLTLMTHNETFRIPVVISTRTYLIASLAVLLSGVLSALIVRRRIDTLDLVAVLKTRE
jgi:putative ABC transport system permease protein